MFKSILVPIAFDHGKVHERAVAIARTLLAPDGTITLLHVLEEIPVWISAHIPEGISEENRDSATAELREIAEDAGPGVSVKVIYGHSGRTIVDYADAHGIDCIVIASHRPELQDYFLGSTAAMVARHADASVVVVR